MVKPLADAIRRHNLPRDAFERLLLTRERDMDDTPFRTVAELEAYADGTSAALIALAASPVYAYFMSNISVTVLAAILGALGIARHQANIRRLLRGEESRFTRARNDDPR